VISTGIGGEYPMYIKKLNTNLEEDILYSIIERVDSVRKNQDLDLVLKDAQGFYDLKNLSYAGFNMGDLTLKKPFVSSTYKNEWVKHYNENHYFELDPVLKIINKTILPIDWQSFDVNNRKIKKFFAEAQDAGVGENGISVPVRGRYGDLSVFSLTRNGSEKEWLDFKRQYMRDFQVLAVHFHQSVLSTNKILRPEFQLSDRELEVLYWAACGKTADEIATILNITKRGVRFHMGNIMLKMNSSNVAHAVAKGIYYNIIKHPR